MAQYWQFGSVSALNNLEGENKHLFHVTDIQLLK
jgi:hypothetical protein